ncbi:MAG: thioredoxin domain-containing protein [Thermoguttaceae bacterium]|jgi:uncharacterized protein YyaL (SSP411 family)
MPNRLADELSPYLLQHADNPVDWYPWGAESLSRAREEGKPIFLSIGYSACHWCHVMEQESFEDPRLARLLNEEFIPIKVDREEHPELDQLYMEAVQMMTGHGGWPLSVFLTPALEPFFGGTYWPPQSRGGMPGFEQVLLAVADAWEHRRDEAVQHAERLAQLLRDTSLTEMAGRATGGLDEQLLNGAAAALGRSFDPHYGGFGPAPKFPHPMDLRLLLRCWRRQRRKPLLTMVTTTLDRMAAGGIYDHLGGGFHRYSTDARWLVPHFEKMLYDNALLASCYLEAWQVTGNDAYARVVRETLDYVLRDMTAPEGGFYCSEDADSEGEEGKFYLWTPDEVRAVLGPERAKVFNRVYDVTEPGNFEGRNILNQPKPIAEWAQAFRRDPAELAAELEASRQELCKTRARRPRPGRDDKILVSWNGLMIDAMAQAGAALGEPRYVEAAAAAARFLLDALRRDGRLLHTWRHGEARVEAFLDDYASLAKALLTLYEARFEEHWIDEAVDLADGILRDFADHEEGGFFYTAGDQPMLIARKKDMLDSSLPSGGGLATMVLLWLGKLCGRNDYLATATQALQASLTLMERAPSGTAQLLLALDLDLGPAPEIVILGSEDRATNAEVLAELRRRFLPNAIAAFRAAEVPRDGLSPALSGIFAGKTPAQHGPTVFVCQNFSCQAPVAGKEAALATIADLARAKQDVDYPLQKAD